MLKKTIAASGILVAAATGAIIASQPASAQAPAWGGGCCSSNSGFSHGSHTRNRNWSGNENEGLNHIRLHLNNRNNNIAVARTHHRENEINEQQLKDHYYGGGGLNGGIGAPGV